MDKTVEVIALYASATQNALVTLSKCLMENGALKPGQFSSAIKATLNEAEVDPERPDYHYLQVLAAMLDGAEARAGGTN
jgi:hypothetical protein